MKRAGFVWLFLLLTTTFLWSQSNAVPANPTASIVPPGVVSPIPASQPDNKAEARILDSYGKLPLSFEANKGQADAKVKFMSRTGAYSLFLTGDEAVFTLRGKHAEKGTGTVPALRLSAKEMRASASEGPAPVLCMKLRHANPAARVTGVDELAGTSNYFIGSDPAKWRTNVPTYAKVKYEEIYSGIDLVYYGNQRQLEYDFIVAPGADPRRIAFDIRGAKRIRRDAHGELVLKMGEDEIRWQKPVVYQEKDGTRQLIAAHYTIRNTNRVGFELAKYDASKPLYIDPLIDALIYSSYLGGSGQDQGFGIAVDGSGDVYVTGSTNSPNFPVTLGGFQTSLPGQSTLFVSKLNPTGSALVYSTYLGGSGYDEGNGIAVDSSGDVYVTGSTSSSNFPVTPGAFQTVCGGGGGGCYDAFVSKLNPTGSALVYSTYLGGSKEDQGNGIVVDNSGDAYVTGFAQSTDFPVTPGAFQTTFKGNPANVFVSEFNSSGSALVYSTYLGGSGYNGDQGFGIAVDSSGDAYVTGVTVSTDFPVTPGAFQTNFGGGDGDAFVSKLNPTGSALVYSTYLGGSQYDGGEDIVVDGSGNAYVTGSTISTNFPTMNPFQPTHGNDNGNYDVFVSEFNSSGSALVYSTYLGGSGADDGRGIAVDSLGNTYVTGGTSSANFPVTPGAFQTSLPGQSNAFVSKIGSALISTTTITSSSNPSAFGQPVMLTATVTGQSGGTPTGTVEFTNGSTTLCSTVTLVGGVATCTYSALPVGSDIVTGTYSGDFKFGGSSGSLNQTVNQASTTLMLTSSLNPSGLDSPVTFTATITPQYGGQATGTVTFKSGSATLGSSGVSGNAASLTTSGLAIGTHSVTAVYSGDSNFTGSTSNVVSQVVTKASTTTSLASSVNPSVQGKSVTFTAAVSSLAGTPTGKIEFLNGTEVLATVKLTSGSAKYTTTKLLPGSNSITAVYEGDANNNGSTSSPVNQFVLAATTTALTSSPNPSTSGEAVTFTATVASSIGAPADGESVSFMKGTTVLGTGTLSGGLATFTTSTLKVGTNSVSAVYPGDTQFAGSKSGVVKQVVEK
jgi:Bacterial Ig-like domain (group 3)/Beta-propeller repeat